MNITIFLNRRPDGRQFLYGYSLGDPLEKVYSYDSEAVDIETAASRAFAMFNGAPTGDAERGHTDAYYGAGERSLSQGDVVRADTGHAVAVAATGFVRVDEFVD